MYGRCTWAALMGAWNTLSVFTARKHAHLYGPHSPPIITGTMYRA